MTRTISTLATVRRGSRALAIGLIAVLAVACQGADEGSTSSSTTQTSVKGSFDVGGHKLFLSCRGSGAPTIVYLHGLGGDHTSGNAILAAFTDRVRVCGYDRTNAGQSDMVPVRHTGADSVRELHALLAAAAIPGPYLLLGASFGGLLATMYAASYRGEVVGMVLLDATLPSQDEIDRLIPKQERAQGMAARKGNNPELVHIYATLAQARGLLARLPDIPVTYLAAQPVEVPPGWPVQQMRALFRTKQQEFIDMFPRGRLVVVESPHNMEAAVPDKIIQEIDQVLRTVRG
jgi:pimeloyl-ACP methyl ester carboxylesterase